MIKQSLVSPPTLSRVFTSEDRARCIRDGRLLGVALRLPCQCNLKCRYCYSTKTSDGIGIESILSFCSQAKALGARTCSIVGDGEPLLFPQLNELISSLRLMTIDVILYSNLVGLSESTIDFLIDHEVTLVFKQNTLDEEKQDWLCGVKGTHKKIHYWSEEPCAKSTGRQKQRSLPRSVRGHDEVAGTKGCPLIAWTIESKMLRPFFRTVEI